MAAPIDLPSNQEIYGYPFTTIDTSNNPFLTRPEDLNEQTPYVVRSDQIEDSNVISWKLKGEPRLMPFLGLPMVLRGITRVFLDGDNRETEGKMLQYEISTVNGTISMCRIWKGLTNQEQVGGPFPFDYHGNHAVVYPFPAVENQGDFLELLDLDFPLFPPMDLE